MKKVKTILLHPITIVGVLVFSFLACNKLSSPFDSNTTTSKPEANSVKYTDGKYHVDTSLINQNQIKKSLLNNINREQLEEKLSFDKIPDFIKTFLNQTTKSGQFIMADPNDEWYTENITTFSITPGSDIATAKLLLGNLQNLPTKKLVYCGIGKSVAILSFYCGGFGTRQNISIIKFDNEKVIDLWYSIYNSYDVNKKEILKHLNRPVNTNKDGC